MSQEEKEQKRRDLMAKMIIQDREDSAERGLVAVICFIILPLLFILYYKIFN
jgi:hypothetical protein